MSARPRHAAPNRPAGPADRLPRRERHLQPALSERGSVLIIVLWTALGLVGLAIAFGHSTTVAFRATANEEAARQADAAIAGAARYAAYLLANLEEPGQLPLPEDYYCEQVAVGEATFWFIGRRNDGTYSSTPCFGLVDEGSRLNLNLASQEMLEALPGMDSAAAAAIIDWRDEDEEVSDGGAESETYLRLDPAYSCKNGPFESVEELLLVSGVDWALLYGEDANRNGVLDPNENDGDSSLPADNANGILEPGIIEFLTVHSSAPARGGEDSELVNVNGDTEALSSLLEETFGEERAREITQRLGGQSTEYGSLLEFFLRSGMTAEESAQIEASLTLAEEGAATLVVNVNTAGPEVLACIPGIGEEKALALVAYRAAQAEPTTGVAWVTEVLEEEQITEAGPYLIGATSQVTADIAAVGPHGRGYRRALVVIGQSAGDPHPVYRKDMQSLGWALGPEIARELAETKEARR